MVEGKKLRDVRNQRSLVNTFPFNAQDESGVANAHKKSATNSLESRGSKQVEEYPCFLRETHRLCRVAMIKV